MANQPMTAKSDSNHISLYIIVGVDYGETCDGHASLISKQIFLNKEYAKREILKDMETVRSKSGYEYVDEAKLEIWKDKHSIGTTGCTYSIIELP